MSFELTDQDLVDFVNSRTPEQLEELKANRYQGVEEMIQAELAADSLDDEEKAALNGFKQKLGRKMTEAEAEGFASVLAEDFDAGREIDPDGAWQEMHERAGRKPLDPDASDQERREYAGELWAQAERAHAEAFEQPEPDTDWDLDTSIGGRNYMAEHLAAEEAALNNGGDRA